MQDKSTKYSVLILILFGLMFSQCSLYKTAMNMTRLKYRLSGMENIYIAGVSVGHKSKLSDFSVLEIAQISSSVIRGSLPLSFVLNVAALNPNDGTGGYPKTNATIKSFPYRLVIDQKEIFTGNIFSPFYIPGTGEEITIPLSIQFDILKNFENKGYESLVHMVLILAGKETGSTHLELYARPVVGTDYGDLEYPGELKIIEKEFSK